MPGLQPILKGFSGRSKSIPSVQLLPLSIAFDGPANIKTYFVTRPIIPSTSTSPDPDPSTLVKSPEEGPQEATFRGRLVLSTPIAVPEGYTGLIFSTSAAAPPSPVAVASTSNKRIKLDATKGPTGKGDAKPVVVGGKSKPLLSRPKGRTRTSPRKSVQVRYSMDSDEDEGDKDKEGDDSLDGRKGRDTTPSAAGPPPALSLSTPTGTSKVLDTMPEIEEAEEVLSPTPVPMVEDLPPPPKEEAPPQEEEQEDDDAERLAPDQQHLVPYATFSSIQIYNPDMALDVEEDSYARSILEWVGIAEKVCPYFFFFLTQTARRKVLISCREFRFILIKRLMRSLGPIQIAAAFIFISRRTGPCRRESLVRLLPDSAW